MPVNERIRYAEDTPDWLRMAGMVNTGSSGRLFCRVQLQPLLNTPEQANQCFQDYEKHIFVRVGAKLCRTVDIKDRSCPSLV